MVNELGTSGVSETKERILEAAERLFAEHGFDGTSMRMITGEAEVSLALVNYHFGSKHNLLRDVITRRMEPINEERLERLRLLEERYGDGRIPVEELLLAFIEPMVKQDRKGDPQRFMRVAQSQIRGADKFLREVWRDHFMELANRYLEAFRRALPHLEGEDIYWRMHFLVGLVLSSLTQAARVHYLSEGRVDGGDWDAMLCHLVKFARAGFEAPALAREGILEGKPV